MQRAALAATVMLLCASTDARAAAPVVRPQVIAVHAHDPAAFTQGLTFHAGELFETTGLYGESQLRAVDPATGKVRTRAFLDPRVFGEGSTVWKDAIYVLTWREQTCFVYGLDMLRRTTYHYDGEGWGLTHDDSALIMSDGTATLRFVDPDTFATVRRLRVTENGQEVGQLNELETIRGRIWANVWMKKRIVEIDPASGEVVASVDLSSLDARADANDRDAVANGIAFDPEHARVFVTGKRWPRLFEIKVP